MNRIKVLIGSEMDALPDEHEAVCRAIRQFRFERFRAEIITFPSGPPEDTWDALAERCDLFVLIIGKRYGRVISRWGVSAGERMFDIARLCNPGKVLVYVESLSNGDREKTAEDFFHRITVDAKTVFQVKPFRSPEELADSLKHDITIWLTAGIALAPLQSINVLSLPLPREIVTAAVSFLAVVLCFGAAVEIFKRFQDVPLSYFPSILGFFPTTINHFSAIYHAVLLSWGISLVSYLVSIFIGSAVYLAFFRFFPYRQLFLLRVFSVSTIAISAFIFLFGSFRIYIPAKSVLMVGITGAAILLFSGGGEDRKPLREDVLPMDRFAIMSRIGNLYISPLTGNLFVVVFALVFLCEIMSVSWYPGVGLTYMYSKANLDSYLSFSVVANALLVVVLTSYLLRLVQSYLGWKLIIRPAVFGRKRPYEGRRAKNS